MKLTAITSLRLNRNQMVAVEAYCGNFGLRAIDPKFDEIKPDSIS